MGEEEAGGKTSLKETAHCREREKTINNKITKKKRKKKQKKKKKKQKQKKRTEVCVSYRRVGSELLV